MEIDPATNEKRWELQFVDPEAMAYRADPADGCALFADASACDRTAARLEALAPVFD